MTIDLTLESFLFFVDIATKVGILLIVLVLILMIMRVIRLLGVVTEITEAVAEMVELVNLALWKPIHLYQTAAKIFRKFMGKK